MKYILIPVLIVLIGLVILSLVRGIAAFLQSTRQDLEQDPETGASAMQLRQNQMMFARIKYQALAVIVVAILLAASRG
jgi:hypothetical protein